jgi:CheY-like chemotaxis protein
MTTLARLEPEERSVLIISSHRHLRAHYARVLKGLGVRILAVHDGFEALELLRGTHVHAIFADFLLPGMDALELYLLTKELHFQMPFVICSNELSAKDRSEALQVGIAHIVRKPTLGREIESAVRAAIEMRESQISKFFC